MDLRIGPTVHLLTPEYDKGRILAQCKTTRCKNEDADFLSRKVLRLEHVLYSQVLVDIQSGLIDLIFKKIK